MMTFTRSTTAKKRNSTAVPLTEKNSFPVRKNSSKIKSSTGRIFQNSMVGACRMRQPTRRIWLVVIR